MSGPSLKLTPDDQPRDTYFLERRRSPRRTVAGRVTSVAAGPDVARRIGSLQLLNISDCGIGAISQEPVDIGSTIAVFFPPHGAELGFDLYGTVVRCHEGEDGSYRIGILLRQAMAA